MGRNQCVVSPRAVISHVPTLHDKGQLWLQMWRLFRQPSWSAGKETKPLGGSDLLRTTDESFAEPRFESRSVGPAASLS